MDSTPGWPSLLPKLRRGRQAPMWWPDGAPKKVQVMHPQASPSHLSLQAWMPTQTFRDRKVPQGPGPPPPPRPAKRGLGGCLADTCLTSPPRCPSPPTEHVGHPGPSPSAQSWRLVYLGNISGCLISGIGGLKISQSLPGRVTSLGFERVGRSQPEKPRVEARTEGSGRSNGGV